MTRAGFLKTCGGFLASIPFVAKLCGPKPDVTWDVWPSMDYGKPWVVGTVHNYDPSYQIRLVETDKDGDVVSDVTDYPEKNGDDYHIVKVGFLTDARVEFVKV